MFLNLGTSATSASLHSTGSALAMTAAERGLLPETWVRPLLRSYCARHLREEYAGGPGVVWQRFQILLEGLRHSPIDGHVSAVDGEDAVPLPDRVYELALGPRMLESSGYFDETIRDLDAAEEAMLALCAERAQLDDGQSILELGSGWGAMTLWVARRFPNASITTVCRNAAHAGRLQARCEAQGSGNVTVLTQDIGRLAPERADFDRVISIGTFEHLRNYDTLMTRIASWLRPGGTLFVHMLCHRELMYTFEGRGLETWLGHRFCNGRLMAAASTLLHFQQHLTLERRWMLPGSHYRRTIEAWLQRLDDHREEIIDLFAGLYGRDRAACHYRRHRLTLLGQMEMFGYADGGEWMLGHYRFVKH